MSFIKNGMNVKVCKMLVISANLLFVLIYMLNE